MEIKSLEIKGIYEINFKPFIDERGFFTRTYDHKLFKEHKLDRIWVQENHSFSRYKDVVRGIHFQFAPDYETKIIRIILGKIMFAIVDLRLGSKTFGKSVSIILDDEKKNMIYIPRGCGTSMCTLSDNCHIAYKMDNYYNPKNQGVIKWNDPDINIKWPIDKPSEISNRDANAMTLKEFVDKHKGIDVKN